MKRISIKNSALPILACITTLLCSSYSSAEVVEGPNGNFYEVVTVFGKTWHEVELEARQRTFQGQPGHLATLTSKEENDFVFNLTQETEFPQCQFWLGGFQLPGQAYPQDGWMWINDEGVIPTPGSILGYENWLQYPDLPPHYNEPNDWPGASEEDGEEDYLTIGLFGENGWNDVPAAGNWPGDIAGYVVEYESREVKIAVRPDSPKSPVNSRSQGVLQVALYSSDKVQAENVDISKITFGKTGLEASVTKYQLRDLNQDGKNDLLFFFSTPQCGFSEGDSIAVLRGKLKSGLHFRAEDSITVTK